MLDIAKELGQISLFASLSELQCRDIESFALVRSARRGECVFGPNRFEKGLYIVLKGRIKLVHILPGGQEALLAVLGRGGWFGEESVLGSGAPDTGAFALEAADYLILPRQPLMERIKSNSRLSMDILSSLCQKLHEYANAIAMLRECDMSQRLARYLHDMSEHCDTDGFFGLKMPKYVLAAYLGAARESVSRCLKLMIESKLIEMRGQRVRILDERGLLTLTSLKGMRPGEVMPGPKCLMQGKRNSSA